MGELAASIAGVVPARMRVSFLLPAVERTSILWLLQIL